MPDAIVIGAGLAGLSCARDLAGAGLDVQVLEARERAGGRTERVETEAAVVDAGGELIGRVQHAILGLVGELGIDVERSYTAIEGHSVWLLNHERIVGEEDALLGTSDHAAYISMCDRMEEAADGLDPARPWEHPDAARLDALPLSDYARELGATEPVVDLLRLNHLSMSCDAPERSSALDELRRYSLGPMGLAEWEAFRPVGGTYTIALTMAGELDGRIRFGAEVERIARSGDGVEVTLRGGETLRAPACISTIPAGVLHGVALEGLGERQLHAARRLRQSMAAKVVLVYDRSFWQEDGLTGLSYSTRTLGSTWEQRPGVLSGLVPPERFSWFSSLSEERRREVVLEHVAALFGDEARSPRAMVTRLWGSDPYTRGYIAWRSPGDVTALADTLWPDGEPLMFAGSDISVTSTGYMNGAVESGRAAAAALAARGS